MSLSGCKHHPTHGARYNCMWPWPLVQQFTLHVLVQWHQCSAHLGVTIGLVSSEGFFVENFPKEMKHQALQRNFLGVSKRWERESVRSPLLRFLVDLATNSRQGCKPPGPPPRTVPFPSGSHARHCRYLVYTVSGRFSDRFLVSTVAGFRTSSPCGLCKSCWILSQFGSYWFSIKVQCIRFRPGLLNRSDYDLIFD